MTIRPLSAALAAALFLGPALAHAQTPILPDRPIQGALSADSPKADDGTPYQLYVYRGQAGERVRITMDSDAFDAYLAVGRVAAPSCPGDCRTNDDGGEGTNAALTYTLPASGEIQIRANSIGSSDAGAYTLTVRPLPAAAAPTLLPLVPDQAVTGRLGASSPVDDDERPFQLYTLKGRPGQDLVVRMDSTDFDPILGVGEWREGQFLQTDYDDDGGPGLNARLRVRLDSTGESVIKAHAVGSDSEGSYRLRAGVPPAPRPISAKTITIGESVRARITEEDAFTSDEEINFHVYRIEGRPGQRITARMESDDFDPLLRWGSFNGNDLDEEAYDDDGGGGTSALLTVTLDEHGSSRLVATSYNGGLGNYTLSIVSAARSIDGH